MPIHHSMAIPLAITLASAWIPTRCCAGDVAVRWAEKPEASVQSAERYAEVRKAYCDVKIGDLTEQTLLFAVRTRRTGENDLRTIWCRANIYRPANSLDYVFHWQLAFDPNGKIGCTFYDRPFVCLIIVSPDTPAIDIEDEAILCAAESVEWSAINGLSVHGLATDEEKARVMSFVNARKRQPADDERMCNMRKEVGHLPEVRMEATGRFCQTTKLEWDKGWRVTVRVNGSMGKQAYEVQLIPEMKDDRPVKWRSTIINK